MLTAKTYLLGSIAMGSLQVVDSVVLQKNKGHIPFLSIVFSISEFAWAFVSYKVWSAADPAVSSWLPASFVAYVIGVTLIAAMVIKPKEKLAEFEIPEAFVIAGGIFGLYFVFAASAVYAGAA